VKKRKEKLVYLMDGGDEENDRRSGVGRGRRKETVG